MKEQVRRYIGSTRFSAGQLVKDKSGSELWAVCAVPGRPPEDGKQWVYCVGPDSGIVYRITADELMEAEE